MSLSEANIFHLRQILKDFHTKTSAFVDNHRNCVQILCLVSEENEILVRYRYYGEQNISKLLNKRQFSDDDEPAPPPQSTINAAASFSNAGNWKLIVWFQRNNRTIQSICFDSKGCHLLVVCYDNTLHIVPILWIINPEFGLKTTTSQEIENFFWPFRSDEITSFIIPFSGPHECSNSKTCPNNANFQRQTVHTPLIDGSDAIVTATDSNALHDKYSPEQINETVLSSNVYQSFYMPASDLKRISGSSYTDATTTTAMQSSGEHNSIAEKSPDGCEKRTFDMIVDADDNNHDVGKGSGGNDDSGGCGSSSNVGGEPKAENLCPFPMSVVWWSTSRIDGDANHQHRAIVAYSDGSICVVGLAPNCPFIANTSIESKCGGIQSMTICRDTIVKSVSLLITTTSKEQWKLLLEQSAIGYVFPDEIQKAQLSQSQNNIQSSTDNLHTKINSEQDWQFVIPVSSSNDKVLADDRDENDVFESDGNREALDQINGDVEVGNEIASGTAEVAQPTSGIIPAARARLASLRDLGAKKIGALKLKLIENKIKSTERDRSRQNVTQLVTMGLPSFVPEILTTKTGPFFIAQYLRDTHLLSALHSYSNTLSVHSMDVALIPLYLYKIPKDCTNVLLMPNIMYTTQKIRQGSDKTVAQDANVKNKGTKAEEEYENKEVPSPIKEAPLVNAIGVIGCNSTVLRIGEDSEFKSSSMLGLFPFPDEKIVNVHRVSNSSITGHPSSAAPVIEITSETNQITVPIGTTNVGERPVIQQPRITTQNYVETFSKDHAQRKDSSIEDSNFFDLDDKSVLEHCFPTIELDQCLVVTDRSLYMIELNHLPHVVFLNLVKKSNWKCCEEFCKIFNIDFNQAMEYAGDVLLRKNKVTQALHTYNLSRIPAVKTSLKLAMMGQNGALMHLCAMALKIGNILKSVHSKSHTIDYVSNARQQQQLIQHEQQRRTSGRTPNSKKIKDELNVGVPCSDFSYDKDETPSDLQMSNSSQFHLSNLLLLTLTEKTIKDKHHMMPLWNYLVVNKRYHTNMSSIVLAQSGLYSSVTVLALNRGAHMDAFCALVGVTNQEFGWYSEINDIMYQLSDPIFMECIIYLQSISMDYFDCIQSKCGKINQTVLERLRHQLDPFTAVFRPVVSQLSSNFIESGDLNKKWIEFCKHLIETFLMVIIRLYTLKKETKDETTNGLNTICVRHEQNQFAIKVENGLNISAGFAHAAAIIDGSCYLWGSNGVNCALNLAGPNSVADSNSETSPRALEFISNMSLEVHAVKCGKAHTLVLTNNGLYSMGSNLYQQLGIGKHHVQALQPMLIREFDGKNVTLIEAGQYHNAVYADGELYTWGWGIWGQLGHGNVFNLDRPKRVQFFSGKSVKQIALGHAHTLVLCSDSNSNNGRRQMTLYGYGCNIFGQLGIGQYTSTQKCLKSSIPIKIDICNETIMQIHTKFFTNFVITKSNKLYTWGASPQLIRLLNQSRKRSRMNQKCDGSKLAQTNDGSSDGGGEKRSNGDLPNGDVSTSQTNELDNQQKPISIDGNDGISNIENVETIDASGGSPKSFASKLSASNLQDKIKNFLRSETATRHHEKSGESEAANKINSEFYLDDEYTEHFLPNQVDTSDVVGQIIQVSSGLYHNVLLTNVLQLYTWGRNLEKQLGRENSRCDLAKPTLLELRINENVICIDCGADFTLIMTDTLTVKAFGNNNVGQCGREMNIPDRNGYSGKLVRLKVSKRLVRLPDSSQCVEQPIEVPLPRPKIRMNFDAVRYLKSMPTYRPEYISREIFRSPGFADMSPDYNSLSSDGGEQQNAANISIKPPKQQSSNSQAMRSAKPLASGGNVSDVTSEYIHYCLFILHGIYDAHKILNFTTLTEFKVRILMLNYHVKEAFALCLSAAKETIAMHQSQDDIDLDNIMLTSYIIKLFEYFTLNDANIVPIHRTDLKYLIQEIFMYFIENSLAMEQLEQYFLHNIDHYLFGLAYVLFFNKNNTKLERQLHKKYSHLFGDCTTAADDGLAKNFSGGDLNSTTDDGGSSSLMTGDGEENESPINPPSGDDASLNQNTDQNDNNVKDNYDILFDHVSVTFKAIICQRLIKFDKELN